MRHLLATLGLLVVGFLASLVPTPVASAGTALRLDLRGLVQRSELVLEARVLSARTVESEGLLATEYLLEVTRTFKGAHEAYRVVRLPGGLREDQSGLLIPGVPRLASGEDTLLFLEPEGARGSRMTTGLAQGRFTVRRTRDGRKELVRDLGSIELVTPGSTRAERGGRTILEYAEALAEIEAELARERAAR
jgi:hypothetical protein